MPFTCEFKVSCSSCKEGKCPVKQWTSWALGFATAACIITFGGLGSVQNTLAGDDKTNVAVAVSGIDYFDTDTLDSTDLLRYFWFIVCFQLVACVIAWGVVLNNKLVAWRLSLTGLFVVATLLTIQSSNSWLEASETDLLKSGLFRDRVRTTVAGFIICAAMDAALVLGFGWVA